MLQSVHVGVVGAAMACAAGAAQGGIYLSAVVMYFPDANGASLLEPGEYDNIAGSFNAAIVINGAPRGTSFLLGEGANAFTFSGSGGYSGVCLYFSDSADPFGRAFGSAPDLVVYGTTMPLIPAAGTLVQTNGQFSGLTAYSGATSFAIGDLSVSVTGFSFDGQASGTFELTVVPAPASAALLGVGVLAARRRR